MKLPEHIRDLRAGGQAGSRVDSAEQGRSRSDLGGAAKEGARRKLWLTIAVGSIGVSVLGAFFVYVSVYVDPFDGQAIQGEWRQVNGDRSKWSFYDNGLVDTPWSREHYSISPLLHTIAWGDSWNRSRATYELNGDSLKIWVHGNDSTSLYILERVSPRER